MADGESSYTAKLSAAIDAAHEAYKAGEPGTEASLYEALLAQANNVVWHRLGASDGTVAYVITHRAFIALGGFRGKSRLSTWFITIARNEVNRTLREVVEDRRDRVTLNPDLDPDSEIPGFEPVAATIDLDATLDLEERLKALPPEQAEVIRLHLQGFTLEEIAAKMGAPLGTTRGRYTLAKAKMARK